VKTLGICSARHRDDIVCERVHAPTEVFPVFERSPEPARIEAHDAKVRRKYRQPAGPDIAIGRYAVAEHDRFRLLKPRRGEVGDVVIQRAGQRFQEHFDPYAPSIRGRSFVSSEYSADADRY
jgi:hypothetical protein